MRSSLWWMRSSLVVRASDCQCRSTNSPGFDLGWPRKFRGTKFPGISCYFYFVFSRKFWENSAEFRGISFRENVLIFVIFRGIPFIWVKLSERKLVPVWGHESRWSLCRLPPPLEHPSRIEIIVRGQSYFSRLPKYWPPIPLSARRVCTPRLCCGGRTDSPGGEGDGGVNILEDERNRIAL
jgi:hypothetical protein